MKYENVKIGDEFILYTRYAQDIRKVTAVTPKRFTVGGFVFAKKDGSRVGKDTWNHIRIALCTDELRASFIKKYYKQNLIKELSGTKYDNFTLDQLEKTKELFESFMIKERT